MPIEFKMTLKENAGGKVEWECTTPASKASPSEIKYAKQLQAFIGEFEKWSEREAKRPKILDRRGNQAN